MRLKAVLVLFIFTCICARTYGNKKCYFAKTCIHDAKEKCGEDEKGNVRRFLDSCDIKEYNCLHGTDYKKTSLENCHSLPSIQDIQVQTTLSSTNKEKFKETSEEKSSTQAQLQHEVSDKESVSQHQSSRETTEDEQTPKDQIDPDVGSNAKESIEQQEENDSNLKGSKEEEEKNYVTNANETEVNAEATDESSNDNTKQI
ncbi:unnamed protein product [Pieris macdunnoughi]|uniref:Uncharacterized protein n=1 Tax=Pieris macdunnoughi TaxID=345717 RepID=A0A821RP11_9NEOP|nr:unnamed protein product [Pieris macdunnoughi]